ncbi:hypothetical protein JAAARDRAFT_595885 [Jaapia argillacea MUCL 33604]|uniref:Uncharacterized protein n=1 Tax=Jaapia argillacea MUCL 33604 TaxID=933084 RepID=A0A067PZ61_9AGAM|nr:hypothetical protein JAAARDRAFT_595885 [Jaapia argillacea MUCL 33604]
MRSRRPFPRFMEIMKEIDSQRVALARHRNKLAPISTLPDELLLKIFATCVADQPLCQLNSPSTRYSECITLPDWWINITYVCHHWRTLAIASRSLWTHPPMFSPVWGPEMIRRSDSLPLVIQWSVSDPTWHPQFTWQHSSVPDMITAEITRVKELSFCSFPHGTEIISKPLRGLSATQLESLSWKAHENARRSPQPVVLDIDCPNLRRLFVRDIAIHWNSQILRAPMLVSLVLICGLECSPRAPSTRQLLDVLRSCNKLQTLTLKVPIPRIAHGVELPLDTDTPIPLPQLQCISLQWDCRSCTDLLNLLAYPASVSTQVHCTDNIMSQTSLASFFDAIASKYRSGSQAESIRRCRVVNRQLTEDKVVTRRRMQQRDTVTYITVQGFTSLQLGQEEQPCFSLCLGAGTRALHGASTHLLLQKKVGLVYGRA